MMRRQLRAFCGVLALGAVAPVYGQTFSRPLQQLVDAATLTVVPGTCAGVVVADERHAITAAHCIGAERRLKVEFHDGRVTSATVAVLDRERDVALLELADPASVNPLRIATQLPRIGEALYFGGRQDRQVEQAIFTNLRARKGDSGAPLVNKSLEVVGLVHGGARCNIATPIIGFELKGSQHSAIPGGSGS
jgi:S1-C subfamily serine protease